MHLNECFQLAFARPADDAPASGEDGDRRASIDSHDFPERDDMSFLAGMDTSSMYQPRQTVAKGSVVSAVKCIASEWLSKSKTDFYIPPDYRHGYSYLYDDGKQSEWSISHSKQHNTHFHEHNRAFVYAGEPNNLHPHHYDIYTHNSTNKMTLTTIHSPINLTTLRNEPVHNSVLRSQNSNENIRGPVTVPYIHPHLDMPVPPLQLPLYFGALCWTFTLAGVMMLVLPPKWARVRHVRGKGGEYRMHWFPYDAYAWALILFQGPCSFMADYVNMTYNSPWHTIDRFLACFLMALQVVKLIVMRQYTRPLIYTLDLICCAMAVFCFMKSQKSQQTLNEEGFVFWHCGWHCYPISGAIVYVVDHWLNQRWGEYFSFESAASEMKERGECGGILLSAIAMNCCNDHMELKRPDGRFEESTMDQTPKNVRTRRAVHLDCRAGASFNNSNNGMASPLRRSRRLAGQKPEIHPSL